MTIAWNSKSGSTEDAVRHGQRQAEQVKIKMGMQMDNKTFQTMLLETQVDFAASPWEFRLMRTYITKCMLSFFHKPLVLTFILRHSDGHPRIVLSKEVCEMAVCYTEEAEAFCISLFHLRSRD
jgi:hypothetical protein